MLLFHLLLIFASFALYFCIVPVFLALMIPMYIWRILAAAAQKLFKPHWVGIMNTRDTVVGLDDYANRVECAITGLITYQGVPDIEFIRHVFQKEVLEGKNKKGKLSFLRMTYYFEKWLGFTFWKKERNFSIQQHVRECTPSEIDPSNCTGLLTEDQLLQSLGHLATKPFAKGVSPWEVIIIRNYKHLPFHHPDDQSVTLLSSTVTAQVSTKSEFAMIMRVHHAIGDGFSIMKLFLQNLSGDYNASMHTPLVPETPVCQKILLFAASLVLSPYYLLLQLFVDIDRSVWHIPRRLLTKRWQFTVTKKISFDMIKETSKNMKVSATAVLLAGLAGGIRSFLEKRRQVEASTLLAMKAVAPMPWKNHPMDTMTNHWTFCGLTIPINESTIERRLQAAQRDLEHLRTSPLLLTNFLHVPIIFAGPNWLTCLLGRNRVSSLILTNFPGPNYSIKTFYGKNIALDVISWMPHLAGDASCGIAFVSYNGGLRLSISADEAIIKTRDELDQLRKLIAQEFVDMHFLSSNPV